MPREDLTSDIPESFADLESSQEQVKREIDFDLSQPCAPAILKKMRREREELERLSQKPLPELSGEEALQLIWGKQLNYAEASELFELWWKSIDHTTQREINTAAENFEDLTDYQWKSLTSAGGTVMNATKETFGIRSLYERFQADMPKITPEQFTSLRNDAIRRRKILLRGHQRSAVTCFIEEYLREARGVLHKTFLIRANRPTNEQQRDRQFSKQSYEGLSSQLIAQQWNRGRRRSNRGVTPAVVTKAVSRYRRKREPVMWLLRIWIYQFNLPKLAARTCPQCHGKGEIYFGNEWIAWQRRRQEKQDWRAVPEDDPEPPCPPPQRCDACGGSGIRTPKRQP